MPKLSAMAVSGQIEAYNLPLGTLSQLFRDIAGHRAGTLTKVGLRTFVDPRVQGGKINDRTTEDLVRVMEIDGEEWLFYKAFPISVALLRGTTADLSGNITMEREALTLDNLALAMAAKNCNGFVIAQVERVCAHGALNPRQVQIPGVLVDCVVVAQAREPPPDLRHGLQPRVLRRAQGAARHARPDAARRAQGHRAPLRVRAADGRRRQSRHRHAGGRGRRSRTRRRC